MLLFEVFYISRKKLIPWLIFCIKIQAWMAKWSTAPEWFRYVSNRLHKEHLKSSLANFVLLACFFVKSMLDLLFLILPFPLMTNSERFLSINSVFFKISSSHPCSKAKCSEFNFSGHFWHLFNASSKISLRSLSNSWLKK